MTDLYDLTMRGTVTGDDARRYFEMPSGYRLVIIPDPLPEGWSLRKVEPVREPGWYLDPKNNLPWYWTGSEWGSDAFPDRTFLGIEAEPRLVRLVPLDGPKDTDEEVTPHLTRCSCGPKPPDSWCDVHGKPRCTCTSSARVPTRIADPRCPVHRQPTANGSE